MAEPPTRAVWLLLLEDDEGAWAFAFSTRRKALAFALQGWKGSVVYWKRRTHTLEEFCRPASAYGCRYKLHRDHINGPF